MGSKEPAMLRVIEMEQAGVVCDVVVAQLELLPLGFDVSVPAHPVDHRPRGVALVTGPDDLEREPLEQRTDMWVQLVILLKLHPEFLRSICQLVW